MGPKEDKQIFSGRSFLLEQIARASGKSSDSLLDEMRRKEKFLLLLDKKGRTNYEQVSKAINDYYVDPVSALLELEKPSGPGHGRPGKDG